jgi:uncharacterized protein (UPF0333 family)
MKRGQISVEFITIFGFVLIMIIPLIVIFFDQSNSVQDAVTMNHLRNIAIKLTDKAENVYYMGEPTKTTVKAFFPDRIESINITKRTITFRYRSLRSTLHDLTSVSLVNITGNISVSPGIHYIEVIASGGEVSIKDSG